MEKYLNTREPEEKKSLQGGHYFLEMNVYKSMKTVEHK